MSKKQFTLDSWLKDKSQKVVTRCGFPVRIVCTDVKRKDYPILALVERDDQEEYQSFTKDGRFSLYNPLHDNFDLFIETADEVSKDEKILEIIKHCIESRYLHTSTIKGISQKQCLAWLEKQGSLKDIIDRAKDSWYNEGKIAGMAEGLTDDEKYQQGWHDALENQGEKHPEPYNGISFEYNGHIWGMCARDNGVDISCDKHLIKHLKKQGQVKESTISQHEIETCEENDNSLTCEDEKVRKEIVNYFQCQSEEEPTRKEIHNKWIAWLENIPVTIDHEKREGFHLGYKACLERQGEQKPQRMISAEAKEAMYDKPAWSEEDVRVIDDIFYSINEESVIEGLNDKGIMYALKDIRGIVRYLRNWLQDLKRRVQPQPKQEWSEEDEEILRTILSDGIRGAELDMLQVNWLKSLRPQNHWKPSDEQIAQLQIAVDTYGNEGIYDPILTELLFQLKKLKEGKV